MTTAAFEQMINKGISTIYDESTLSLPEKTLVVLGTARGGTSAIAGALDKLGLFTGDSAGPPVYEDLLLSSKIESGSADDIKAVIEDYNQRYPIWAYKRPRLLYHIEEVYTYFRNPIYIVIFRDLFAAAQRTKISGKVDIFLTMKKLLGDNERIINFIDRVRPNTVLVSYEKLLAHPDQFIKEIIDITGIEANPQHIDNAIQSIKPGPSSYLDATRTNKAIGEISYLEHNIVEGWAKYNYPLKPSAHVELKINNKKISTTVADLPASNFLNPVDMPAGTQCGFRFSLADFTIKRGDTIAVRATDEIVDLENSPQTARIGRGTIRKLKSLFNLAD